MRFIPFVIFLLLSGIANAAPVTIDFEAVLPDTALPVATDGYLFGGDGNVTTFFWPSKTLNFCSTCAVTMAREDGNSFSLMSFDMARTNAGLPVTVTGEYASGGSVSIDLAPGGALESYVFGNDWSNLAIISFDFTDGGGLDAVGIDNIIVSAVPVPAAAWLFGSALAALGWMRRKQTV